MTKKSHSPKLTPGLEEELRDRLEEGLDAIDDTRDKRRRLNKVLRGHEKVLESTVDLVRRQLKGIDLDQLEIPGTKVPEAAKDPLLQEILRVAGIAQTKPEEPDPLIWAVEDENLVAGAEGGTYCIEPRPDGFAILFTPEGGRSERFAFGVQEKEAAKKAATNHNRERFADAMLKNAGDGALTKKADKGSDTRKP
jgi:hypothetical protein